MAQLWFKPTNEDLTMLPLSDRPVRLSVFPPESRESQDTNSGPDEVILENLTNTQTQEDQWLLITGETASVWVDGTPQNLGIYHLADGQEVLVKGAGAVVLTTEKTPEKTTLPVDQADVICPRCKTEIDPGSDAVQCPTCDIWHHERDDLPCWTYEHSTHCAMCAQPTDLDGGLQRIPEGL